MLAHEIKAPISAVNLALRAVAEKLGEDDREVLEDLVRRMRTLEQTMKQTLSFAKPLDVHRERTDARALFDAALILARTEVVKKGVQVELGEGLEDVMLAVDVGLVEEVLVNLIHNAVNALPMGGRIRLGASHPRPCWAEIVVEDDGPGVPDELREAIFKPFVTFSPKGTGLGLAIAKRIVEEHGGEITLESSELGGARFEVRLPSGAGEKSS